MSEVQRWADPAMFSAEPVTQEGPQVTVIDMTVNPLRKIAAPAFLYQGRVVRDPNEITREEALKFLMEFKRGKIAAPLEWVNISLLFENVTRAFTHQLVRQRTATFVQESLRFAVKEDAAMAVALPPSLAGTAGGEPLGAEPCEEEWQRNVWDRAVDEISQAYLHLVNSGIPAEDARGLLPTNILTRVHYTTNLRNLVDHSGMRLCSQAQHEWKQVWIQIIRALLTYGPVADRWQQKAIVSLFKPICFQTGKCEFNTSIDRYCSIRERVERHHANGDDPETWDDIDPREPLHRLSAVAPRGV